MKPLSKTSAKVPVSGIRKLVDLANSLQGVIHLEVGEPDFPTPSPIVEGSFNATRAGFTKYTATAGTLELRRKIADRVNRRYGSDIRPEQIVVAPGAATALTLALLATLDPGDEVLVPDPGWPSYAGMVALAGGTYVPYRASREDGFVPNVPDLRERITPRTKVLMLNNPGNPGGGVFTRPLVEEVMRVAAENDLYVIADEIYEDFTFDGEHVPASRFDRDGRLITISGFSKTYAMTGWRLGYGVASDAVASRMTVLAGAVYSCPSAISQSAAIAALGLDESVITAMRDSYRRRRDIVVSILQPAGLLAAVPRGAFYAMVDLSSVGPDSEKTALDLLESKKVATVPGRAFGAYGEGMVRISFATAEADLTEALNRIVDFARAGRSVAERSPAVARPA